MVNAGIMDDIPTVLHNVNPEASLKDALVTKRIQKALALVVLISKRKKSGSAEKGAKSRVKRYAILNVKKISLSKA